MRVVNEAHFIVCDIIYIIDGYNSLECYNKY